MEVEAAETPIWVPRPGETARRTFAGATIRRTRTPGADEADRTTVTINTADEDRHGTIIEPRGARLDNYKKNPVVLINHLHSLLAGTSSVSLSGGRLVANMQDDEWDLDDPEIARWFSKLKKGFLRAASIGFMSHEIERELIDPDGDPYDWKNVRYRIVDWELLEWSYVTVPSNYNALVTQRELARHGLADPRLDALVQSVTDIKRLLVRVPGLRTDDDSLQPVTLDASRWDTKLPHATFAFDDDASASDEEGAASLPDTTGAAALDDERAATPDAVDTAAPDADAPAPASPAADDADSEAAAGPAADAPATAAHPAQRPAPPSAPASVLHVVHLDDHLARLREADATRRRRERQIANQLTGRA